MTFEIPSKYGNVVCAECHNNFPQVYHSCLNPCSHLVSWASHEARQQVVQAARTSVWAIKNREEYEDCLLPQDTSQLE